MTNTKKVQAKKPCLPNKFKMVLDVAVFNPLFNKDGGMYYIANCNIQSKSVDGKWVISREAKRLRFDEYIFKVAGHIMLPGAGFIVTVEQRIKHVTTYEFEGKNYYHNEDDEHIVDMVPFVGTEANIKVPKDVAIIYAMRSMEIYKLSIDKVKQLNEAKSSVEAEYNF